MVLYVSVCNCAGVCRRRVRAHNCAKGVHMRVCVRYHVACTACCTATHLRHLCLELQL